MGTQSKISKRISRLYKCEQRYQRNNVDIDLVINFVGNIFESVLLVKTKPDFIAVSPETNHKIQMYLQYHKDLQVDCEYVTVTDYGTVRIHDVGVVEVDSAKSFQLRYCNPALQKEYLRYLEQLV